MKPDHKPSAGRVAAHRARLREQGLRPLSLWALPEHHQRIKDFVAAISNGLTNKKGTHVHDIRSED
jgi:hypothetical protein